MVSQLRPQRAPPGVPAYWGRQADWAVPGITGRVSQSLCPLLSRQTLSRAGVFTLTQVGKGEVGTFPQLPPSPRELEQTWERQAGRGVLGALTSLDKPPTRCETLDRPSPRPRPTPGQAMGRNTEMVMPP